MVRVRAAMACATLVVLLSACDPGSSDRPTVNGSVSSASTVTNPTSTAAGSAATGGAPSHSGSAPPSAVTNPLADDRFWVDPNSHAAREESARRSAGKTSDAALLARIAVQPTAVWLGSWQALDQVGQIVTAAGQTGATPLFVAYYIPDRDCGGSSAGGARDGSDYRNWVGALASKLGNHRVVVVLEPDAVPMSAPGGCAASSFGQRSVLLAGAIRTLKARPAVSVYLDAGHPAWPSDPTVSVTPLLASGLAAADGFALNTSNFQRTSDDLHYGDALSALVGGKHFIVDTGRNGNGPLPDGSSYRGPSWCNPPGRALGRAPTTVTGDPLADAFLWVKYPGESDGSCGLGDLPAGSWLPDYAIGLARRAQ